MQKFYSCALLCLFVLISGAAIAQTGSIKGFVYDESNNEPMVYVSVYLEGTSYGAATDINGYFSIPKIPVGDYTVVVNFIGYEEQKKEIKLTRGQVQNLKLYLSEASTELAEVEITAEKQDKLQKVQISTINIDPITMNKLPTVGGEADVAQYLQVLPGVVFTGDQGGQIYIRGGSAVQTLFLLDGTPIYNPFHSIGLFSVYETDIIKNVEVMTGGFSAEYGNRTSAVVDITTRDGNKKQLDGKLSASTFLAKGLLEGPIFKMKENGTSSSFILTGKGSYLKQSSNVFYSYANENQEIPFNFFDGYAKMSFNTSSGNKASLFGFHFRDDANFQGLADFKWRAYGIGGKFIIIPGKSNAFINTRFNYSDYGLEFTETDDIQPRTSDISGFNFGMDFTYFLRNGEARYGFDVTGFSTKLNFFNSAGLRQDRDQNTTELAAYFKYRKFFQKFVIEPSLRAQFYGSLGEFSIEPRLRMKVDVTEDIRIKAATGIYSQNLISTKSDRDIVNLFTGFLSGPDETLTDTDGSDAGSKLQRAFHLIGGVEYDLGNNISFNVEGYWIKFLQLININRDKVFSTDPDFQIEDGESYGVDFSMKYEKKRLYTWAAYSLGKVTRFDGEQTYPPHFDRRHNLNLVGSYTLGKNLDWQVSARFNAGTGFAFTLSQGFYEDIGLDDGVNTNYTQDNGNPPANVPGIVYDNLRNRGRLSNYFRLDISGKKTFFFGENIKLEANVSITNVFDRENIFYLDRVRNTRIDQLPFLTSFGLALSF